MTEFFETRVENLEPREGKKSYTASMKKKHKKDYKKRKKYDSDSIVIASSNKLSVEPRPVKKYC